MNTVVAELERESLVWNLVEGLTEVQKNGVDLLASP